VDQASRRRWRSSTWSDGLATHAKSCGMAAMALMAVFLDVAEQAPAFTIAAFDAEVIAVADGDTLTVLRDDKA